MRQAVKQSTPAVILESKYEDQTENSESQETAQDNESREYKFNDTEDSQLYKKIQNNWDNSFTKEDQEPSREQKTVTNLTDQTHSTEQLKVYCLKSRQFKEAKSE